MNYTITLTFMELIDIAGLLGTHVELCNDLAQEAEASEYQTILDKIRSRIAGHPDPEELHPDAQFPDSIYAPDPEDFEEVPTDD